MRSCIWRPATISPARSGLFFNGMYEAQANPQAYDVTARKKLRALSLELTGLGVR